MRGRWIASTVLASLLISAHAPAQGIEGRDYVILPADRQWVKSGMLPHWTPSDSQARSAIAFLSDYIKAGPRSRLRGLDHYRLQVFGVTASVGNNLPGLEGQAAQLVIIQGVCDSAPAYLKDRLGDQEVVVLDGGSCFFRAYVDVDGHRMAWLSINGYA